MKNIIDLGYGNPAFLQELWEDHNFFNNYNSKNLMPYKYGRQSTPLLAEAIKLLHKNQKNALITDQTRIVITVGGSQALQAAMAAYKKIRKIDKVFIPAPYWGKFDDFAGVNNLTVTQDPTDLRVITSPNNPDGADKSHEPADIRDACYNWSYYTKNVVEFSDPVVLFSLAKLSGHASTRVGWAIVQDEQLAKFMQFYVNTITLGVSVESQEQALGVLNHLNCNPDFFQTGSQILTRRQQELDELIKSHSLPIKVVSPSGMFWYIETNQGLIDQLFIECTKGEDLHDPMPNRFRLNLGCSESDFQEFKERLSLVNR